MAGRCPLMDNGALFLSTMVDPALLKTFMDRKSFNPESKIIKDLYG